MSYLLDALNKSKGEPNTANTTPQPVYYQQSGFGGNDGVNVYKWISIILALVLTLILGIVLGNKYALLGPPQPAVQSIAQPLVTAVEPLAVTPEPVAPKPKPKPKPTPEPEPTPEPQKVITGEPRQLASNNVTQDADLPNISNDLLSKFNQAIKDSEGVELNHKQTFQPDPELDEYFSKVPTINELQTKHQLKIPSMIYQTHVYSSDPSQRSVKINGKNLAEQQWLNDDIEVIEIENRFLILQLGHIRFRLAALTDWEAIVQ